MVFSNMLIITGVVLTEEEFRAHLLGKYVVCDEENETLVIEDSVTLGGKIEIFTSPCCSVLADKVWIVGFVSRRYPRKRVHCGKKITDSENCSEEDRLCCDDCINRFIHCDYDVERINNNVTTAPDSHFCSYCKADNQKPFDVCQVCNYKYYPYEHKEKEKLEQILKDWNIQRKTTNIYMLDDCTSCT